MLENKCTQSQTEVIVKSRRRPRFKAGSDLSTRVNRVVVEINEESIQENELIEVKVHLLREECEESKCPKY